MPKRPTSADVAAAAGVSRATVSYVLNNQTNRRIPESTREKIIAAAQTLGYNPSAAARALRRGKGDVVIALLPDQWNRSEPIARLLADTSTHLAGRGLTLMQYPIPTRPAFIHDLLGSVTTACVVTFEPLPDEDQATLAASSITEVRVRTLSASALDESPRINQRAIVRTQMKHLLAAGCKKLVFVSEVSDRDDDFVRARLSAFVSLAAELGVADIDCLALTTDRGSAEHAVQTWADQRTRVGVCAFSDIIAGRILAAARRARAVIPEKIAVIGVDDSPFAPLLTPPLSSVGYDLAREAVFLAVDVLKSLSLPLDDLPVDQTQLSTWVVQRDST